MTECRESNIFSKFQLLTWLGAFFCFILIPLLLINALIDSNLRLQRENEQQKIFAEMDARLDYLSQNVDLSFYLHKLMKAQADRAEKDAQPLKSLEKRITAIKKQYPGLLKFIVWDGQGKTVDSMTDEKSYRYIVNNLYGFFGEIARHCRNDYPGTPELLPIVEARINLFRAYLGRFLVPSQLRLPFQKGDSGRFILTDIAGRFPLFWFDVRRDFTIFCAANPNEEHQHIGVESAIRQLNKKEDKIETAFIDIRELKNKTSDDDFSRQLLIELGKFENASLPHQEMKDHLITFKLLDPYLRGYCKISKSKIEYGYPQQLKAKLFARLALAIALLLYIFYCYSLRLNRINFSIRTRIALLFIYANGLPLLILGTIGHEYLQQLESELLHKAHRNHERLLEEVDSGFKRFRNILARQTQVTLASYSAEVTYRLPKSDDVPFFKAAIEKLDAEEAYIFAANSDILMGYRRSRKPQSQTMFKLFAAHSLRYFNRSYKDSEDGNAGVSGTSSYFDLSKGSIDKDGLTVLKSLLHISDKVEKFSFGTEERMCYIKFFGDKKNRSFHSVLILSWLHNQVQEFYARQQASELSDGKDGGMVIVGLAQHSGNLVGKCSIADAKLRPILHKAFNLQSAHENALYQNGKRYIVTALAGRQLDNLSLAAIIPADTIEIAVKTAQIKLMWLSIISLLIVSGVVYALTRQFLEPVRQLAESVKQIGQRNFSFRNTISSNDEFGDLGKVFNSTMAGMRELELGKIVQETLLPDAYYQSGNVEVFAKSVSMTKLGGDYFDYCQPEPGRTGIFMGDVAGHGIPAALIMAMAKAIVLIDENSLREPALLLTSLHNTLYKLKSDGFKRMMTCQYLVIDDNTGVSSFANAGHCYPIIVSDAGTKSEFIEIIGSPVGIARRARYQNNDLKLNDGDTLILYSDGMLEARNNEDVEYGPKRLLDLARQAWHKDIQQYYTNLYQANLEWSAKIEDDITIVLIRFAGGTAV